MDAVKELGKMNGTRGKEKGAEKIRDVEIDDN